jgi:hypothetical protein
MYRSRGPLGLSVSADAEVARWSIALSATPSIAPESPSEEAGRKDRSHHGQIWEREKGYRSLLVTRTDNASKFLGLDLRHLQDLINTIDAYLTTREGAELVSGTLGQNFLLCSFPTARPRLLEHLESHVGVFGNLFWHGGTSSRLKAAIYSINLGIHLSRVA